MTVNPGDKLVSPVWGKDDVLTVLREATAADFSSYERDRAAMRIKKGIKAWVLKSAKLNGNEHAFFLGEWKFRRASQSEIDAIERGWQNGKVAKPGMKMKVVDRKSPSYGRVFTIGIVMGAGTGDPHLVADKGDAVSWKNVPAFRASQVEVFNSKTEGYATMAKSTNPVVRNAMAANKRVAMNSFSNEAFKALKKWWPSNGIKAEYQSPGYLFFPNVKYGSALHKKIEAELRKEVPDIFPALSFEKEVDGSLFISG